LLKRGLIKPFYVEYRLEDAAKAHEDMERGVVFGRAVILV
jgi:alcohol dehydrogenase